MEIKKYFMESFCLVKCVNMHSNNIIMITKHLRLFLFILIDVRSQHYRYNMRSTEWVSENSSSFRVSLFFLLSFLMLMLLQLRRSGLLNCYHALFFRCWLAYYNMANVLSGDKWGHDDENWYCTERASKPREKNSFINHSGGREFSHSVFFSSNFFQHMRWKKNIKKI